MYQNNQMYVKLTSGLTQPFVTSVGVKQGCVLSPLIFNLFINDPVVIADHKVQALMFADDVMVLSQLANGLKRAINITVEFFTNINLSNNNKNMKYILN